MGLSSHPVGSDSIYLDVSSVRTDLNCRTPRLGLPSMGELLGGVGKTHIQTHILDLLL